MVSAVTASDGEAGVAGEIGVMPVDDEDEAGNAATAVPYRSSSECTTSLGTLVSAHVRLLQHSLSRTLNVVNRTAQRLLPLLAHVSAHGARLVKSFDHVG